MTEIRPIPGVQGYFAGDDGMVYKPMRPYLNKATNRYELTVGRRGHEVHKPLAWYIARAWGIVGEGGQILDFANGDTLDTRPRNLVWRDKRRKWGAKENREFRHKTKAHLESHPEDGRHGTQAGYGYGCKCERCRAFGTVMLRKHEIAKTLKEIK